MKPWPFIPLILSILPSYVFSQTKDPVATPFYFQNLPARVYYFDDTTHVLYHDGIDGVVHVSDNEGKTFRAAEGVPKGVAAMLVEHPFDNQVAFILGKDKTHYRTKDRGKTWQSFETPVEADIQSGAPLSFHVDPTYGGHVLFQGLKCRRQIFFRICSSITYYSTDLFSTAPKVLLEDARKCIFAHSSLEFKHDAHQSLVYCIAFDQATSGGEYSLESARLLQSNDFFDKDIVPVNLAGRGEKNSRGVLALAVVGKFLVVALRDLTATATSASNMHLIVSQDAKEWALAHFPRASSSSLREDAYTILSGTTHSLAVDVLQYSHSSVGTLFVSNSNGTYFVESLTNTNRNAGGFVDFEAVYGIEGVAMANTVANAEAVGSSGAGKVLKSVMTFDDGSSWNAIKSPASGLGGKSFCSPSDTCSLHLHSVTTPHNFGRIFSSPAPGYVIGIGSVGASLNNYDSSSSFLSSDGGVSWSEIYHTPTKYEFGGKGSIMVYVDDEDFTDRVRYSMDGGTNWKDLVFPNSIQLRAKGLLTLPDSTSQKFILIGTLRQKDRKGQGDHVSMFLDFAEIWPRKCEEGNDSKDFEKWFVRSGTGNECVMGHKQYYLRRKADAMCAVGHKFEDPKAVEENCQCTDSDFECDYNFVRVQGKCEPAGPLPISAKECTKGEPGETYMGSSGYRKIPGNTCTGGVHLESPVTRQCKDAQPTEGNVVHTISEFNSVLRQNDFFKNSQTILIRLEDGSVHQSSNEGYSWSRVLPDIGPILAIYMHPYSPDRAYLVTGTRTVHYTKDKGAKWDTFTVPSVPNIFELAAFAFHPGESDYLIWTGTTGACVDGGNEGTCIAEAQYSTNHGYSWTHIDNYVKTCSWARDKDLKIDSKQIMCESYQDKKGDQRTFNTNALNANAVRLVTGTPFFQHQKTLFENVVGFAKFSEYMLVAEYLPRKGSLDLQVSLDGKDFATGLFPPSMRPDNHAYTILESSTDSVFVHLTTSEVRNAKWGSILKSNSNGTYYTISVEDVSRNDAGYVDFEKMIGLDGIALVNVVSNTKEATSTRRKELQSRISHNDGGTWKTLNPPAKDSFGRAYACTTTECALHIHGFTERYDARATFSSPSIPGILMGVGNVGKSLAGYTDSDTFLSRDGGFQWEEIHKDAHLWEFGDSGSVLILVNDEEPTDKVLYSTNEGGNWSEYSFDQKLRIRSISNAPSDTSRKFILFGHPANSAGTAVAVHVDFSQLTTKRCVLDLNNPENDDFELWSPADERKEKCLFGRQTQFHRRKRESNCFVGDLELKKVNVVNNCECSAADFECEFNHIRNSAGECALVSGAEPLSSDISWDVCNGSGNLWYERTAYRKIPHSTCEGGVRLDRGAQHPCPGLSSKGFWFWLFMALVVVAFTTVIAMWWRRSSFARGTIRLPDRMDGGVGRPQTAFQDSGPMATLASIPWFVVGLAGVAWSHIAPLADRLPFRRRRYPRHGGYRTVAVDEDAQVLRFEDEE